MKFITIPFILFAQMNATAQQSTIKGHWRPVKYKSKDTTVQYGDFLMNKDFTFLIVGHGDFAADNDKPGYHFGGTMKGNWIFLNNILTFKIRPRSELQYNVLKLSSKELIMVHPALPDQKLKLKRIKDFS